VIKSLSFNIKTLKIGTEDGKFEIKTASLENANPENDSNTSVL